jgi:glycosyltransferase involved in cell wall biosynthesis
MSEPQSASVSVVIPTYERRERLPELLDAVLAEPAAEIIVVVSACRDGSLELLEERARGEPRLRPMFVAEPGQTVALQVGVEASASDVVLMLDDDVLPQPGLVEGHARHHAAGEGLVVLGYMPVARPSRRRRGEFPLHLYSYDYERTCEGYEREPGSILESLWAGNVSMRRADCLRVGLRPGPGIPAGYGYHEDRDLGLRCRAAGLRGVFDRRLCARHLYEKTPAAFRRAARNSGVTRAAVHRSHADAVGPLPDDFFVRAAPMPGRLLVRLARRRRARWPVLVLLGTIAAVAGTLRLFRVETHAGFLIGLVEQQRGALEVAELDPRSGRP